MQNNTLRHRAAAAQSLATAPEHASRTAFRRRAAAAFARFLAGGDRIDLTPGGPVEVSVLVILYNQAELSLLALRGLAVQSGVGFETIIVDNASTDGTDAMLRRVDGARVIRNSRNLGFLDAVNAAAPLASGQGLLLLNSDAIPAPDAVARAWARLFADPTIGAVTARIVLPSGRLQEAGPLVFRNGNGAGFGAGRNPDLPAFRLVRDVDYCCGAFLMTRTKVFASLGGFDPVYRPAYYEETDYCFRLREAGYRNVYEPAARVTHFWSGSAPSALWPLRQMLRNRGKFVRRHRAALAGRARAFPDGYLRALAGRPTRPWTLILSTKAEGRTGAPSRAMRHANRLLAAGRFVTVGGAGGGLYAGRFPEAGVAPPSPTEPWLPREAATQFDHVLLIDPAAGSRLLAALGDPGSGGNASASWRPRVLLDREGFAGPDGEAMRHALARAGIAVDEVGTPV